MLNSFVSVQWLKAHLDEPNLMVLYTTLVPKKQTIPPKIENLRINSAQFFDLQNVFSDQESELPNTFPSVKQFEEGCRNLGINSHIKIIVYDVRGIYSSPRVWLMFKSMGHQEVYVLNGGLESWLSAGFETKVKGNIQIKRGNFVAQFDANFLKNRYQVQKAVVDDSISILDARSAARFEGDAPEPRHGLRSGNIPTSSNLHYASLLSDGKYKSEVELEFLFKPYRNQQELIFSCGSGITACILFLAASELLHAKLSVYDGSWTEWGSK